VERKINQWIKTHQLDDGTIVEVRPLATKYNRSSRIKYMHFDKIRPILVKTCTPIVEAVERNLRDTTDVEQVEVEVGFSFAAKQYLYHEDHPGAN